MRHGRDRSPLTPLAQAFALTTDQRQRSAALLGRWHNENGSGASLKMVKNRLGGVADFSYWQCYEGRAIGSPDGPIAQLDRVTDFYSVGCRFESCWDRQFVFSTNDFNKLSSELPNFSGGLGNRMSKPPSSLAMAVTASFLRAASRQ
jgi:hypothetical protein